MPCYSPLTAYQCANGEVVFVERSFYDVVRTLSLPCSQCIGCRLERSRQWAMRCMHEASLHESNCFVTLTYDDAHLPKRGMLDYPEFQRFMKRLRKRFAPRGVRFYMCGEYGPENWRPHYHVCLFGVDFEDKKYWKTTDVGEKLYTSRVLERLWPFGFSSIGSLTFESAAYCARYCVQKVTGDLAKYHYKRYDEDGEFDLPPEFNQMSRMPGIGAGFLEKWKSDIYPRDVVVINGKECKPPRYYDKIFAASDEDAFIYMQFQREVDGRARYEDNTPERLMVKQQVQEARAAMLRRYVE